MLLLILGSLLLLGVTLFIYKLFIVPYLQLQFYKKQGLDAYYIPILGILKPAQEDIKKHGDFFHIFKQQGLKHSKSLGTVFPNGGGVSLSLKDPELLKQFHTLQDKFYIKTPEFITFQGFLMGDGMIFSEGEQWKRHRKLISSAFNFEFLKEMVPDVVAIVDEMQERLKTKGGKISAMDEFHGVTGEIIGRLFFGESFSDMRYKGIPLTRYLLNVFTETTLEAMKPWTFMAGRNFIKKGIIPSHKRLVQEIADFKVFMKKIASNNMAKIAESRAKGANQKRGQNLLEAFYDQRMTNTSDPFTDEELVDEFITFLHAGMTSTGNTLAFATRFLLLNPECKATLMKEIDTVFKNPKDVTLDTLNQMDYMIAVIKETLRLATPAPILFPRVAKEDHNLGSLKIKKGTLVNANYFGNNYNPEYHVEPENFMPERWLDANSQTRKAINQNAHVFSPFSGGARNCIGQHLAMIELRVTLSLFLKKFDYKMSDPDFKPVYILSGTNDFLNPLYYDLTPKQA